MNRPQSCARSCCVAVGIRCSRSNTHGSMCAMINGCSWLASDISWVIPVTGNPALGRLPGTAIDDQLRHPPSLNPLSRPLHVYTCLHLHAMHAHVSLCAGARRRGPGVPAALAGLDGAGHELVRRGGRGSGCGAWGQCQCAVGAEALGIAEACYR
eukprot:1158086-Pelagomonas_calceolata.AAC.23